MILFGFGFAAGIIVTALAVAALIYYIALDWGT